MEYFVEILIIIIQDTELEDVVWGFCAVIGFVVPILLSNWLRSRAKPQEGNTVGDNNTGNIIQGGNNIIGSQTIISGKGSTNIQVGGSIHIK